MKKTLAFLSLLVLTLTLCACGNKPTTPDGACLTFKGDGAFSMSTEKMWDGTMEYATDGKTWTEWDGGEVSAAETKDGYVLFFRGTGNNRVSGESYNNYSSWSISCESEETKVACSGNIETLLDYATVKAGEHPQMLPYCYSYMFRDCASLTTAPELPATTLTEGCYQHMFRDCTNLTGVSDLPATTLENRCYFSMFIGCTSLTVAPELPATKMVNNCYSNMFSGCTSLTIAPKLPATELAGNCYDSMFSGCIGLSTAPELPATKLAMFCYIAMFADCTKLTVLPELSAKELEMGCYAGMFANCTSIQLSEIGTGEGWHIPENVTCSDISIGNVTHRNDISLAYFGSEPYYNTMFEGTSGNFQGNPAPGVTYYYMQ